MPTRLSLKVTTTAAALLLLAGPAFAAGEKVCEDYAHAAIVQVRAGNSIPRCQAAMHGTRWSPEWRVHYDWCRGTSYEALGAERDLRTEHLKRCR
jgi:hypothetical protein